MNLVKSFFEERGFDFEQSLKSTKISIEKNVILTNRLIDNIFIYSSSPQTRTSFYIITTELNPEELNDFRTFVWNEDRVDLFFVLDKSNKSELFPSLKFILFYAKSSPKSSLLQSRVDYFSNNEKDLKKLDRISKWQFDSGAFWLNYNEFLDRIKKSKSIDKELILTLEKLKISLFEIVDNDEIVQALIDRTLYIKYLEDNHIINSYFYFHYFGDETISFKKLLENEDVENINVLFKIINEIFNNYLFDTPEINIEFLKKVCNLICLSISGNLDRSQLRLFDFQFNVLPVEFISYIYEVFLGKKQKENGIYYTPKKLAQLIVDDVIPENKIGTILDPACGSGMFLVVAFQKLIENSNYVSNSIEEKIQFRIKLLSENIFGIEKQSIAQRFTIFSLSLQIFKNILPDEIKEYIADKLKKEQKIELFRTYSFFENIICANSLNIENKPFEGKVFDYIVGNPPFFEIKNTEEFYIENKFINEYQLGLSTSQIKVKNIIEGTKQISQCFLLKIKDWSNNDTRFGFVVNNSNFYNNKAKIFQDFFFENYQLEKLYELSKVKKILFERAKESVNALIFNNNRVANNFVKYYPIEMGLFSEKPFELLIINEDKSFLINQNDVLNGKIRLRDYLISNKYDKELLRFLIKGKDVLSNFLLQDKRYNSLKGFERVLSEKLNSYFLNKDIDIKKLKLNDLYDLYANENYLNNVKTDFFNTPYIYSPANITSFKKIINYQGYINSADINKNNFHRTRNKFIYEGNKILVNRYGDKIQGLFCNYDIFFSNLIYVIKLENENLYPLVTAILNSDLVNYFLVHKYRKRVEDNFANIDTSALKNIPIPTDLDDELVTKISKISNDLSEGKFNYEGKIKEKLNNLIFELYGLSYLEKQRVRDYFVNKGIVKKSELELYKEALKDTIEIYFNEEINIEHYEDNFNLIIVKINIGKKGNLTSNKVSKYIINEIFEQNSSENFLASQEKIFGKNCIYIIKKNENINWTETKAYEDGQEILKKLN